MNVRPVDAGASLGDADVMRRYLEDFAAVARRIDWATLGVMSITILSASCGPVDEGPIRADAGDACPASQFGLVACDGPCVVRCGPDGGVWTVRTCNPKCGVEWRAVGND